MTGAPEREGDTIPALALVHPEADAELVAKLAELLERARTGEVTALAFAVLERDPEKCDYGVLGNTSAYRIVGILETLKHQFLTRLVKFQMG